MFQQKQLNIGGKVYKITKQISQISLGNQGSVQEGQSQEGDEVAIIHLNTISETQQKILQSLQQNPKDSIITIKAIEKEMNGNIIIVMEFTKEDLYSFMTNNSEFVALSKDQRNQLFYQMVSAVNELHDLGYSHRDLKPENFLVFKKYQGELRTKLFDFGLCQQQNIPFTLRMKNGGTPYYLAPEELDSQRGLSSNFDSWSLGCIWYELLTSNTFFSGKSLDEVLNNIRNASQQQIDKIIQNQQILDDNEKYLLKMLIQKEANKRIQVKELVLKLKPPRQNNNFLINNNQIVESNNLNALLQSRQQQEQKMEKIFYEMKDQVIQKLKNNKEQMRKLIVSLEENRKEKILNESQNVLPLQYQQFEDVIQNYITQFQQQITKIEENENKIQKMNDYKQFNQFKEFDELNQYNQYIELEQLNTNNLISQKCNQLIQQLINQKQQLKQHQVVQENQQNYQWKKQQEQFQSLYKQIQEMKSYLKHQQRKSDLLISQLGENEISKKVLQISKKLQNIFQQIQEFKLQEQQMGNHELSKQLICYNYFNLKLQIFIEELNQFFNQLQQQYKNAEIEIYQKERKMNWKNQIIQLKEENKKKLEQWDQQQQTFNMQFKNFSILNKEIEQQIDLFQNDFDSLKKEFKTELENLYLQTQETEEQFRKYIDDDIRISNIFMKQYEEKKNTAQNLYEKFLQYQANQMFNQFNFECDQVKHKLQQFRFDNNYEVYKQIRNYSCKQQMDQCLDLFQNSEEKYDENSQVIKDKKDKFEEFDIIEDKQKQFSEIVQKQKEKSAQSIDNLNQFYIQSIKPYYQENFDQIEQGDEQLFQQLTKCQEIKERVNYLSQNNSEQFQKTKKDQINNQDFITIVNKYIEELIQYQNDLEQMNLKEIQQFNQRIPNKVNSWFIQILLITLILSYQNVELVKKKIFKAEKERNEAELKQSLQEQNKLIGVMLKYQSYLDKKQFNQLNFQELIENKRQIKESFEKNLNEINNTNTEKQVINDLIERTQFKSTSRSQNFKNF